jgi:hypothetical protein
VGEDQPEHRLPHPGLTQTARRRLPREELLVTTKLGTPDTGEQATERAHGSVGKLSLDYREPRHPRLRDPAMVSAIGTPHIDD